MKIVFFGSSEFGVTALKRLERNGYSIVAVATQPDRKKGRSLKTSAPPVKKEAESLGIAVYQPEDVNGRTFLEQLKAFEADFFVVVAYGKILRKETLDIPRFCCLNIHASLLPKYRGAAPVNWALINGDKKTGVTIIRMNEEMDTGDIVLQKEVEIEKDEKSQGIEMRLAAVGADLLIEAIELIKKGKAHFVAQDPRKATVAPKLTKKDGRIDWKMPSIDILNRIKGLNSWPGTYTFLDGQMLKIFSAETKRNSDLLHFLPGQVVIADEKKGLIVRTGDGAISILELQLEGKKKMTVELFLRGHRINAGQSLG